MRTFDDPVVAVPLLMAQLKHPLDILFARLQGLSRFAQKMEVLLHCEYSNHKHSFSVEPVSPSRDQNLFEDLLKKKLEKIKLENPVREFEVSILDVAEKIQQMDFFEPRDNTEDRWRRLISFAKQAQCEIGFLQMEVSHFPEQSFRFVTDWPEDFKSEDLIERQEEALQIKSVYAKGLSSSPRPTAGRNPALHARACIRPSHAVNLRYISAIFRGSFFASSITE